MEYIENNEKNGILYDLNLIKKEYKKLHIPKQFDIIDFSRFETSKYIIDLSERSIGKTMNYILCGLVLNKIYGTTIVYLRDNADALKASIINTILEPITSYNNGQYIKQLTDDRYNGIRYYWSAMYFCHYDENGRIEQQSQEPFMRFIALSDMENTKSTLNIPNGDFIIYDEFINKYFNYNTSTNFFNLLSTIIRQRKSPWIIMLANNTNINSMWFEELTISKDIRNLKKGETMLIDKNGTRLSVRWVDNKYKNDKQKHNKLFFSFNNPKLNSITGGDNWNITEYKHIPKNAEYKILNKAFIRIAPVEFLTFELVEMNEHISIFVKRATKIRDSDIVFSLTDENNYIFKLGNERLLKLIVKFMQNNNIYYSTNSVGDDFTTYIKMCKNYNVLK